MRRVIGIDGGGTKTEAVVADESGTVLGRGFGGPGNFDDLGPEGAQENVAAAATAAALDAGLPPGARFDAAFLGMGGVVSEKDQMVARGILANLGLAPVDRIGVDHDCRVALAGGLSGRPGIVLIAGTGSSCYGRTAGGESWRSGGWGHLVADEGSGYWLGMQGLTRAVRAYDGRGPHTALLARLTGHLKLEDMNELMHRLYVDGLTRSDVAALAPLVIHTAVEGDAVAAALLEEGGAWMAASILAVARRLGFDRGPCDVALVGGLFRAGSPVTEPLRRAVEKEMPHLRLIEAERSPALGAVLLALALP